MSPNANRTTNGRSNANTSQNGTNTTTAAALTGNSNINNEDETKKLPYWKLKLFIAVLVLDVIASSLLLTSWCPGIKRAEGNLTSHYTFYGSVVDLAVLAALRLFTCCISGLLVVYCRGKEIPDHPFNPYHPNGDKKSREELEQEALEEPWIQFGLRYLSRNSYPGEMFATLTQALAVGKALARMHVEIGDRLDEDPYHPVFWLVLLLTTLFSAIEAAYLDSMSRLVSKIGKMRYDDNEDEPSSRRPSLFRRISSTLSVPLLAGDSRDTDDEMPAASDAEAAAVAADIDPDLIRGTSDIGPDTNYKASWTDLLATCRADIHLILLAFCFLLLAAIAQVYIPRFLGNILDSLAATFADNDDDATRKMPMKDVPGFVRNVKYLVIASVAAGVFAGIRGSIFTYVGARVNIRLRIQLMDSLLAQDIGFFDVTKTGDITSRLSSDTTLVGDQVSVNVNVFLRSLVQAIGVLLFMFLVSWQLSIIAFVSVPLITYLSKVYGGFVRKLTKLMQKKLADGNSVSEAAIGSMATVRSFDAAESELKEFENHMFSYLHYSIKAAIAYSGYNAFVTAVPQLVFAVVVYYGGLLVRNGDITSGQLVSFLLYLQSLSDAFTSIGYVFSSLTTAVGAADKVFELMHRKPRYTVPTAEPPNRCLTRGRIGIEISNTRRQRLHGLTPSNARGEITLNNVELYYPARPQRRILNGLSLNISPGSIVALVGQSGGGKSSVMSLIQHLYEQQKGEVLLDGTPVHELSPAWLSRHISIVSQEPTLFGRSIKRNIMYGLEGTDAEPTDEQIIEAAKLANADSFIQKMPQKYDTEVGERGVQLSGGQKQRIAIARALVRKPKVLLLDEATSALDAESEHLVQQAIDDMLVKAQEQGSGAMTVLIVAHRLSTVRNADIIFVISDGQVVEKGSHTELLKNSNGPYSSLIRRQMEAQESLENGKATEDGVDKKE